MDYCGTIGSMIIQNHERCKAMLRVAIVEDELAEARAIEKNILQYEKENNIQCKISIFSDGTELTDNYSAEYDIILCDIEMKYMDGIKAAQIVRSVDSAVSIVFVTNLAEFAIKGYEVEALGYLLKPLSYPALVKYLDKVKHKKEAETEKYLVLETGNGIQRIPVSEIFFVECVRHYQYIHTSNGIIKIRMPLKKIEDILLGKGFAKCNSGILVNMLYVQKIDKYVVTVNKQELSIARTRKQDFMKQLNEYMKR